MSDIQSVSAPVQRPSAFLAGPFKGIVHPRTLQMREFERARYEEIIAYLEKCGYVVHNAHRREGWGASFLTPEECTRLDWEQIKGSDVFIAFPGSPPSPGTHIEIGWAAALGKPMILLLEEGCDYAFLVRGLHTVANVTYVDMPRYRTDLSCLAAALSNA
jgi:nucleoside 2-deoxyribosyltransferase